VKGPVEVDARHPVRCDVDGGTVNQDLESANAEIAVKA